ncbi:MAG: SCO family protein [Mucilaginibacter sp.]
MKKYLFLLLVIFVTACSTGDKPAALPFFNTADFTPAWIDASDPAYKTIHTISDFSFTNQLGNTISNKDVVGKIYVANFFFTSCGSICPQMMSNLAKVQDVFAKDDEVVILSHSVTPLHDNTSVLFKYAEMHHINNNKWWLLTGDKDALYKLARQSYFAENTNGFKKSPDEFLHTENLILVDRHGRIRGVYNGSLQLEVDNLIKHINLLKQEI